MGRAERGACLFSPLSLCLTWDTSFLSPCGKVITASLSWNWLLSQEPWDLVLVDDKNVSVEIQLCWVGSTLCWLTSVIFGQPSGGNFVLKSIFYLEVFGLLETKSVFEFACWNPWKTSPLPLSTEVLLHSALPD